MKTATFGRNTKRTKSAEVWIVKSGCDRCSKTAEEVEWQLKREGHLGAKFKIEAKNNRNGPGAIRSFIRLVAESSRKSTMFKPKSFLENGFPVRKLHTVAMAQSNAKMPIYQIHKWWARRHSSVFRALLISSFLHAESKDFWKKYYDGFLLKNKIICDPFMGGGTTLVEGLRLGCRVVGCDINPVAWFVTKKEIDPFDSAKADEQFRKLEESVGKEIQKLYQTRCEECKQSAEVLYCMWIRNILCKKCGKDHDLFSNFVVREKGSKRTIVCPKCGDIFTTKSASPQCKKNRHRVNVKDVPVESGTFTCPDCSAKENIVDAVKRKGGPLDTKMFCVEYYCRTCEKRRYKQPTKSDISLFNNARRRLKRIVNMLEYPKQRIILGSKTDKRPISHGFTHFHQLFNERQLLSLALLLKEIKTIEDPNLREFFLLTFSSSLETNNVLCKYETKWGKVSALFGLPTFHVPERYAENNVWGMGRGSFVRNYWKLKRGKNYGIMPYERVYKGRSDDGKLDWKKKHVGLGVNTEITSSNFRWRSKWKAIVDCRDSGKMKFIPNKKVDAVITDPPYFETIRYSELADFFYVWLRLGLKKDYPKWFGPATSQQTKEAVARSSNENDRQQFIGKLTRVFREARRILKDDGVMVFTFHHTQEWAWRELRQAVHDSGFYVTATPIIRSEGATGYKKGNYIGYDICIVCRKRKHSMELPSMNSPESAKHYIDSIKTMKHYDSDVKDSEVMTAVMSRYLMSDDETAGKILANASSIVSRIKQKAKIKNASQAKVG